MRLPNNTSLLYMMYIHEIHVFEQQIETNFQCEKFIRSIRKNMEAIFANLDTSIGLESSWTVYEEAVTSLNSHSLTPRGDEIRSDAEPLTLNHL